MLRGWAARCSVDRWYRENHFRHELGGGYGTDAYLYNKNTAAAAHADLPQKKTLAGYIILKALSLSLSLSRRPPIAHPPPPLGRPAAHACRTASCAVRVYVFPRHQPPPSGDRCHPSTRRFRKLNRRHPPTRVFRGGVTGDVSSSHYTRRRRRYSSLSSRASGF